MTKNASIKLIFIAVASLPTTLSSQIMASSNHGPAKLDSNNRLSRASDVGYPLAKRTRVSSGYGWRIHPISKDKTFHSGIDFAVPYGTPVLAVQDGVVEVSSFYGGYGKTVLLNHSKGKFQTLYAHLSEISVSAGVNGEFGQNHTLRLEPLLRENYSLLQLTCLVPRSARS